MKLSTIYLRAAQHVADGEDDASRILHMSCCDAIVLESKDRVMDEGHLAYKRFAEYFSHPQRPVFWFGKNYVYQHMTPENFTKKREETKANQQARVYALLFMWVMFKEKE